MCKQIMDGLMDGLTNGLTDGPLMDNNMQSPIKLRSWDKRNEMCHAEDVRLMRAGGCPKLTWSIVVQSGAKVCHR